MALEVQRAVGATEGEEFVPLEPADTAGAPPPGGRGSPADR
jgi:hypothetical protein